MELSRPEYCSRYPFPSPGDLPNLGTDPRYPTLQVDSLPAGPQGKPKNTGVVSLSLLQGIFPIQESNWGLLHCRQILYQLSYQGSPTTKMKESESEVAQSCLRDSLGSHGLQTPRLLRPWDFPGKSTGVGCHFLLQQLRYIPSNLRSLSKYC